MRPIWNGHISFGLISIPISIFSAVESSERVAFRLLHRKDHSPIKYKKFCTKEDVEVLNDEIVRGFEVDEDEYATVEKEELDKVEEEASSPKGEMEVLQFVEFGSLNPLLFENPYYAAPRAGGEKAYGVLRDALNETGRVGIARFQLRTRPTLATLLPGPKTIDIETLRSFEELRDPSDLKIPSAAKKPAVVKLAKMLIDQMAAEGWDPAQHPNTYKKALEKLLASRRRFSLKEPTRAAKKDENVVDLMEALRKSVGQARSRPRKAAGRRAGAA
jgi:DNA end-binding protein Ku